MEKSQLIKQLNQKGYVKIDNFIAAKEAKKFREKILKCNHHKAWNILTSPYLPFVQNKDCVNNGYVDARRHRHAQQAHLRKQFAFSFYRNAIKNEKSHGANGIHQYFATTLIERLQGKVDIEGEVVHSFIANYVKDQFIGYHSDGAIAKYAFIYQLSRGWQRKYGGQLLLYPKKNKIQKVTLEPTFNSLTLLNLSFPMYHSVNVLKNPAHKHRITITGWIK